MTSRGISESGLPAMSSAARAEESDIWGSKGGEKERLKESEVMEFEVKCEVKVKLMRDKLIRKENRKICDDLGRGDFGCCELKCEQ
jgi:hypothetical protein